MALCLFVSLVAGMAIEMIGAQVRQHCDVWAPPKVLQLEAGELLAYLQRACGLSPEVAKNLHAYLAAQKRAAGYLPTDRRLVLEEFPDEGGEWRLLIHSPFGNRVHLALALLLNAAWEERLGGEISLYSPG